MPIDQSDKVLKELLELKPEEYRVITTNCFEQYKYLTITKTIISKLWFVTGCAGSGKTTEVNNLLRNNSEKKLIFTFPKRTEDAYNELQNVKFFEFSDAGRLGSLNTHTIIQEIQENLSGDTKIVVIDDLVLWGHSGHGITEKNKLFLKQLLTYALSQSDIRFYFISYPLAAIPGNPEEAKTNIDSDNAIKILEQRIEEIEERIEKKSRLKIPNKNVLSITIGNTTKIRFFSLDSFDVSIARGYIKFLQMDDKIFVRVIDKYNLEDAEKERHLQQEGYIKLGYRMKSLKNPLKIRHYLQINKEKVMITQAIADLGVLITNEQAEEILIYYKDAPWHKQQQLPNDRKQLCNLVYDLLANSQFTYPMDYVEKRPKYFDHILHEIENKKREKR